MNRSSGILMPVYALPSPYGIGTLGKAAYDFADFLHAAGQGYWQMLPLGPTSYGDSPYQSFSTFAGNPYFIDLDLLVADGLLTAEEVQCARWGTNPRYVDYGKIYESRFPVLRRAYSRGWQRDREEVSRFAAENLWASSYADYMALKQHFGMKSWQQWPDVAVRCHSAPGFSVAMERYRTLLREDIQFYMYLQYLFFKQWGALKDYVHSLGIRIIGDLPIYVAMDSADVWAEPEFFQLDENMVPAAVSGVPPDYFSADGQLWGNPLYRWDRMEEDGFGWWLRRVDGAGKLYDVIRIDHFRGFDEYYSIPYGDPTAENGHWEKGPGMDLFHKIKQELCDLPIIAEDLGFLTDSVKQLLKDSGYPGMKVLQFAFDSREDSDYLPHNYHPNCVVYTGTHDNDTLQGWYQALKEEDKEMALEYIGNRFTPEADIHWDYIRLAMRSVADTCIIPVQDYLGLSCEARINTPSTLGGNWIWRSDADSFTDNLAAKIKKITQLCARSLQQKGE